MVYNTRSLDGYYKEKKRKHIVLLVLIVLFLLFFIIACFVGSSHLSFVSTLKTFFGMGDDTSNRILFKIRLPRVLAAIIAGAGLAISGLVMQTTLKNPLASPSTLGVSNASVFGANLAILVFTNAFQNSSLANNPYLVAIFSFVFAMLSILLILELSRIRRFSPTTVVLAGLGLSTLFQAFTTILQYFSSDTSLANAVYWTFGDLGRASYSEDLLMFVVILLAFIVFLFFSNSYNAMLFGDDVASSLGVNLNLIRFVSLFLASLITATTISILGIIGFVGIIAPHIMKRLLGSDHKTLLITSALFGSVLLLFSDTISRILLDGVSLPVGAITSILGAPIFLWIIFSKKESKNLC